MKYTKIALIIVVVMMLTGFLHGMPSSVIAAGPAFSGIAANADTAETVYLNPAGMTRLKRPSFYVSPMILYTESSTEITAEGVEGKQKIEDDSVYFLPGLYYSRPVSENWYVGIGPNAASGFGTSYGDNWPGRYILDEWSMYFIGLVPSAAYRVNDKLSLGVSASINYSAFNLDKAVFNGPGDPDGNFELETDGWAVGGVVSLLYEFSSQTRFGIVYRSELEASNEGDP
ncbi:MAG: outer membrane protein transport protein, partial [Deltaproteobacteria bacterium]|nr:outer membrane protein transport protein [Deltaproteobacteria bacterium]